MLCGTSFLINFSTLNPNLFKFLKSDLGFWRYFDFNLAKNGVLFDFIRIFLKITLTFDFYQRLNKFLYTWVQRLRGENFRQINLRYFKKKKLKFYIWGISSQVSEVLRSMSSDRAENFTKVSSIEQQLRYKILARSVQGFPSWRVLNFDIFDIHPFFQLYITNYLLKLQNFFKSVFSRFFFDLFKKNKNNLKKKFFDYIFFQ